jgi:hypothetical protein
VIIPHPPSKKGTDMPRVFIPQVPSRFDSRLNTWLPTVNIDHAKTFGELNVMLPPEAGRLETSSIVAALKRMMKDYGPDDYVVALGDPMIIAIASVIAERAAGRLRLLRWDRNTREYVAIEVAV